MEEIILIPTVFILAAGESSRFNGAIKQLLPINGEPIIRRTIQLVREINPNIPIYIVAFRKELFFTDVLIINTHMCPGSVSKTILFCEPYWDQRNVFLMGDTVFYPETLKQILCSTGYTSVGKVIGMPFSGERFAICFSHEDYDTVVNACINAENEHGLREFCLAHHPTIKKLLKIKPMRPVIHFTLYHVVIHFVNFFTLKKHIELHDATEDIDTPIEYQEYLIKYENILRET